MRDVRCDFIFNKRRAELDVITRFLLLLFYIVYYMKYMDMKIILRQKCRIISFNAFFYLAF